MRHSLLYLGAVALGTLHLVGIMLLEAQMHFERPVTRLTIIVVDWHTLSFYVCIYPRALCLVICAKTVPHTPGH